MITLRGIYLDNFLSHKKTEIALGPNARVLIDGESGSGKSSVVDALVWSIYGVGRSDNRSLIRTGQEETTVRLDLSVDPDFDGTARDYSITRKVTTKGKHSVEVMMGTDNGMVPIKASGTREIQEWIEHDLIGASYELFINSVIYPQGGKDSFVEASSIRRKELLLEILNIDEIDSYYEKAKAALKDAELTRATAAGDLMATDIRMRELGLTIEDVEYLRIQLCNTVNEVTQAEKELKIKTEQRIRDAEQYANVTQLEAEATALTTARIKCSEDLAAARSGMIPLKGMLATFNYSDATKLEESIEVDTAELTKISENNWVRANIMAQQPKQIDYDQMIVDLERQIDRVTQDLPKCPVGDACPFYQRLLPEHEYLKDQVAERRAKRDVQSLEIAEWERAVNSAPAPQDGSKLSANIQACKARLDNIYKHRDLESRANMAMDELKRIDERLQSIMASLAYMPLTQNLEDEISQLEEQVARGREDIIRYTQMIAVMEDRNRDLAALAAHRVDVEKTITNATEVVDKLLLLKEAFGSGGIRAIAIDQLIPRFEDKINEVLSQMSDFRIRLDTQKKSVKGESTVEGLFIMIRNDQGQELEFNNYSGGEKLKITVAISEALASMQRAGFRILDELFVGLDESSTESFATVLGQIQGRFSQTLCISHLRQIKDLFDQRVVVTKINGISTTKYE